MVSPHATFRPTRFTQLVTHLHEFGTAHRERMAELYGAPTAEATELAEHWVQHPERVVEVVRTELTTSVGWRIVEEAVLEHDLGTDLEWAPARQRQQVARLGLLDPKLDGATGRYRAVMPAALAAIFADRVRGDRGSLPVLLGRASRERIDEIAEQWELSHQGSRIEIILRICDHFARPEMVEEMLEELPNPDWIGDALMVLEMGGMCHWNQVYNYDLDERMGPGDNVVPLMRSSERRRQREIAETLEAMGVLFRVEREELEFPLLAVPEELWGGLWEVGRRWLMDWNKQCVAGLRELRADGDEQGEGVDLQRILKWWMCEADAARLSCEPESGQLSEGTRRHLDEVYRGERSIGWDDVWTLGKEMRVLVEEDYGAIGEGPEAAKLLGGRRYEFVAEALLEWCMSYSGRLADRNLVGAIGLDEAWRNRGLALMRRRADPVPTWLTETGVEPRTTGGGWLRESGTGPDEIVVFELGLTTTFVLATKVLWLDLLSLLDAEQTYPLDGVVELMQCASGLAMFQQLRRVLEEQPAPIYLPFQRASFLMDQRHRTAFREWVDDVVRHLLVPLGVASIEDDGERIWVDTDRLYIDDPPGWPPEHRQELVAEIFGEEFDVEPATDPGLEIREVETAAPSTGPRLSIDESLDGLRKRAKGHDIASFDGKFIEFEG